ncbi:MAG TPA: methyltransferase domain-containing protein [Thermoplasmata archaeon]|nr:methyltransferase domain-containing protein [Thermoplasmata archaeon]
MPWEYTDEYYREYTRTTWNESSGSYGRFTKMLAPYRADLLEALHPRPGETVLDLGTGPGEPALTIARSVGPSGTVVGIDMAEKMVAIAQDRAKADGLANVSFRTMDSSVLDFPENRFDAVACAFGFQIFTDPERAAREARRVLRPGGRIGVTVWGLGPQVPALDVIVAPMLEHAERDETGYLPTPYETGGPGEMVRFLEAGGFQGAVERRVSHLWTFSDPDDYLETLLSATPLGHSLREEAVSVQQEVLRKTRENLRRWETEGHLQIPAEAAVVTAVK